jgi:DNA-binding transcriptional regulator YiaG
MMTGTELKRWRNALGLSARQMATILGYSDDGTLRRTERQAEVPRHVSNFILSLDMVPVHLRTRIINALLERTD